MNSFTLSYDNNLKIVAKLTVFVEMCEFSTKNLIILTIFCFFVRLILLFLYHSTKMGCQDGLPYADKYGLMTDSRLSKGMAPLCLHNGWLLRKSINVGTA